MRSKDINKAIGLVNYIKKVGVFENLIISFGNSFTNNVQFMTDDGLFAAKNIEFKMCDINAVIAVLRKTKNGVESIKIDPATIRFDELTEILKIQNVQNVPYWHMKDYEETDSLIAVANMWIAKDPNIGTTFQVSVHKSGSFHKFFWVFVDRSVPSNEKRMRIRTNNPDRHILLERGLDDVVTHNFVPEFYRMMVIPAEMKESEYDDSCEEWICKMDPEMRDMYKDNDEYDDYFDPYRHMDF